MSMNSSFISLLSFRYIRAKQRNHFISFISLVSVLGIALGMAVLITVLSVMNGFDKEIKTRMLVLVPEVTIRGWEERMSKSWQPIGGAVKQHPSVKGVAPFIQVEGMLESLGYTEFALIKGVDPALEPEVSPLGDNMTSGVLDDLTAGSFNIILGKALAMKLGLEVGNTVNLFVPKSTTSIVGVMPRIKTLHVVGIFETGFEYDYRFGVMHIDDAAKLLLMHDSITGLQLALDDPMHSLSVVYDLRAELGQKYQIFDWTMQNAQLFAALKMEKTMLFVILTLIVAVAAFNMLSSLVMLVTDKQSDIAILRTMGATRQMIMRIFMRQGMMVGCLGIALGLLLGLPLALNVTAIVNAIQSAFGVKFISGDVYFIDFVPSDVRASDVVWVTLTTLLLSFISTLYPAYQASKVKPAEALRHE